MSRTLGHALPVLLAVLAGALPRAAADAPTPAPHAVYAELGGPGVLYSISYDHHVHPSVALRVGAGLFGLRESGTGRQMTWLTVPMTASYLVGRHAHRLELGGGLTWGYARSGLNQRAGVKEDFWLLAAVAQLGYRYQPRAGGFVLRVTITPMYGGDRFAPLRTPVTLWAGVSAGYAF